MMEKKIALFLTLWLLCVTPGRSAKNCNSRIKLGDLEYAITEDITISGTPTDLAVNRNNLYYNLISEGTMTIWKWNLKSKDAPYEIAKGQAVAIGSSDESQVFIGKTDGLYKYDERTSKLEKFGANSEDVLYIDIPNNGRHVYISTYPDRNVLRISNDNKRVQELVSSSEYGRHLLADNDGDVYYVDKDLAPFILRSNVPKAIKGIADGDAIKDFAADGSSKVYALASSGRIYEVDKRAGEAVSLGNVGIGRTTGFAFQSDRLFVVGGVDRLVVFEKVGLNDC